MKKLLSILFACLLPFAMTACAQQELKAMTVKDGEIPQFESMEWGSSKDTFQKEYGELTEIKESGTFITYETKGPAKFCNRDATLYAGFLEKDGKSFLISVQAKFLEEATNDNKQQFDQDMEIYLANVKDPMEYGGLNQLTEEQQKILDENTAYLGIDVDLNRMSADFFKLQAGFISNVDNGADNGYLSFNISAINWVLSHVDVTK